MGDLSIDGTHIDTIADYEKYADKSVDELNEMVQIEMGKWQLANMTTANVGHDLFSLDIQLITIVKLLVDKGLMEMEEMQIAFRINYLEKATTIRETTERERAKAQIIKPGDNGIRGIRDQFGQQFGG